MRRNRRRLGFVRTVRRLLLGLGLLLAITALGLLLIPMTEVADATPVAGSADWMAGLPDDAPLSGIVLPGTHDSATEYVQLAYFSRCQSLGVREQLEAGFRYLDVRLGTDEKSAAFKLMHGFTECRTGDFGGTLGLDAVLADCCAFLDAHPTETILFAAKYEHGELTVPEVQRRLAACIAERPEYWLLAERLPTLGEARGRLVLLRRWEDEAGLGAEAGVPLLWADQKSREDTALSAAAEAQGGYTLHVQDRYKYETEEKWRAFTEALDTPAAEGDVLLNFLSTNGAAAYGHPWEYAKPLNSRLDALEGESLRGWIIVDFASPKLAAKIYGANTAG